MATSKQIRAYAKEHNCSNAEARAHFINEASNDNMSNAAIRAHYGISSKEAQQIIDTDQMLNNIAEEMQRTDVRFKVSNMPGICAFNIFEAQESSKDPKLLEIAESNYKDDNDNGKREGIEPFVGKHSELINRLTYVMQVVINSQIGMVEDSKDSQVYETIMNANMDFLKKSIKEYLGVDAGYIEMIAPGIDPRKLYKPYIGQNFDDVVIIPTKGFTSWCIKDTQGNVMDIDCKFVEHSGWDRQINSFKQNGLLSESHRRPEMVA
jgi:hypothetical protein